MIANGSFETRKHKTAELYSPAAVWSALASRIEALR